MYLPSHTSSPLSIIRTRLAREQRNKLGSPLGNSQAHANCGPRTASARVCPQGMRHRGLHSKEDCESSHSAPVAVGGATERAGHPCELRNFARVDYWRQFAISGVGVKPARQIKPGCEREKCYLNKRRGARGRLNIDYFFFSKLAGRPHVITIVIT